MDERRLRYFLAVVDEGSVTLAATRQHVAQPSLSQALRGLEAELGVEGIAIGGELVAMAGTTDGCGLHAKLG